MSPEPSLWLILLGFAVGGVGTLIGAGGGFLLVPLLIFLYPNAPSEVITSISLAVVFFNAASGSLAYMRMRRVDYKSGFVFALAAAPGAVLGAITTAYIPRRAFDITFGVALLATSVILLIRPEPSPPKTAPGAGSVHRVVTDADGTVHRFAYNPRTGIGIAFVLGYVSSLLGIGGGILHVPAMVYFLSFPTHIATATSHFVLTFMAFAGTVTHMAQGNLTDAWRPTLLLGIGVVAGAQVGAILSNLVHGKAIIRGLAVGLGLVGVRILLHAM